MRLDRTGVAVLVAAALLDVADEARQDQVAVVARDELRVRGELLVAHRRLRAERARDTGLHRGLVDEPGLEPRVGEAEEQLLARGQVRHLDVDAAVGQHPLRDVDRPVAVDVAGEELAADGVAHVVGEQRELAQAELGGERGRRCRPARRACTRCRAWRRSRSRGSRAGRPAGARAGRRARDGSRTTRSGSRGGSAAARGAPHRARARRW